MVSSSIFFEKAMNFDVFKVKAIEMFSFYRKDHYFRNRRKTDEIA